MQSKKLIATALFALFATTNAHAVKGTADPSVYCNGWVDVELSNPFCSNIEWITNRNITFGTSPNTFSPNDLTPRTQVAAFLNRLGKHVIPKPVWAAKVGGVWGSQSYACGFEVQAQDWPQLIVMTATMNLKRGNTSDILNTVQGNDASFYWNYRDSESGRGVPISISYYLPVVGKYSSGTLATQHVLHPAHPGNVAGVYEVVFAVDSPNVVGDCGITAQVYGM